MDRHEARMVRFLSRRATYPPPVGAIERRETHVSHVFLAGAFAYKLKKPVRFPFLDASTLALRRTFCLLELSLNRRLAPAVYLGIVPIVETPDGLRLGPSTGPDGLARDSARRDGPGGHQGRVIEWVVKMRRLPETRMMDALVARRPFDCAQDGVPSGIEGRRRVSRRDMAQIADRLARFFHEARRSRAISRYGQPAQVASLVLGNLQECRAFIGTLVLEPQVRLLEAAFKQYLALHEPLLRQRVREGRIVDGHGDLRCENICLLAPRSAQQAGLDGSAVQIFDCVEFEPAFRCGDMANDLSFLAMDLEFRGRHDLAAALVTRYRRQVGDSAIDQILPLYQCHRSLVRGKVRGFAWRQHPHTAAGRRVRALSRRHFRLAVRYARQCAPPRLIVVGGLIGTGKSTLARSLADTLGAAWLRTDEIRRREFASRRASGQACLPKPRRRQGFAAGLYAPRVSELVYRRLIRRADAALREGRSVVCDGTFSKASGRAALRAIARRRRAAFHFIECVVPRAVALKRVAVRAAAGRDLSEARPEHYDRLRAEFEPVRGWPARDWTRLSDDRASQRTLRAALSALRRAWLSPASLL